MDIRKHVFGSAALLVIDMIWIHCFALGKYNRMVPKIQKTPVEYSVVSTVLAYFFLLLGFNMFVLRSSFNHTGGWLEAFALGVVIYGVYGFTAAAIFKDWDLNLAITETVWGGVLFSSVYFMTRMI